MGGWSLSCWCNGHKARRRKQHGRICGHYNSAFRISVLEDKDVVKEEVVDAFRIYLASLPMDHDPLYDAEAVAGIMPSFHDISDVEFQDKWGRVW
ncbi:hypothetical protein KSP40_PGU004959 [Platanthera guangdongensis]|uniref:Uncharacterized protein n=1 Tax=Platanthera guangdongensis TaxID=2320717 RepID=A0ABR2MH88_9ASPA